MKGKRFLWILICVFLISVGVVALLYSFTIQSVRTLPIKVQVEKGILGLNTDVSLLQFGAIRPGGGGARFVELQSKEDAWVRIQLEGPIAVWLKVSNSSFHLEKEEQKKIEFYVQIPSTAIEGNYTGMARFVFHLPWMETLEIFK